MRKASIFAMLLGIMLPSLAGGYTTETLRSAGIRLRIEFDTNQDGTTVTLNENGVTLSDAAGADSWAWHDSTGSAVGSINSNGEVDATNYTAVDGGFFGLGASKGRIEFSDQSTDIITFEGANVDIASGLFTHNPDSGDFDFRIAGTGDNDLIHTDAANDRVGIGTGVPTVKLEVVGDILATSQTLIGAAANAAALLTLDQQLDDDAPFINFKGVVGSGKSIDTDGSGGDTAGTDVVGPRSSDWTHVVMLLVGVSEAGEPLYIPAYSKN